MGRGRPKGSKNKTKSESLLGNTPQTLELSTAGVMAPKNQSDQPKRGRGRPRKNPELILKEVIENSDQPKRGRGRPRKNPEQIFVSNPEMSIEATILENSSTEKRGRGRPRKNPVKDIGVNIMSDIEQPKRGRGRPKKNLDSSKKDVDFVFMSANTQVVEEKPFKFVLDKNITDKTAHEILIENEINRQKIISYKVGSNADNVYKPSLSHLVNAYSIEYTEKGRIFTFNLSVGEKIMIEYPQNWRRTEEWIIDDINYENGDLRLKHSVEGFFASCNFIVGPSVHGVKIKKVN